MKIFRKYHDDIAGYAFISPWLICFIIFTIFPVAMSFYYSFTEYDILSPPVFKGLDNYKHLFFEDTKFWGSVKVTFFYTFVSVPLRLAFAFFIAMLFCKRHRGLGIYRAFYYLPSIIGGSVAVSVVWRTLFGKNGAIEAMLSSIGIEQKLSILGNPETAIWSLILLAVWQFGSPMLIFLAGLKDIPDSYYESASIDGAGSLRKFLHITLPMITPVLLFNLVMQIIAGFMVFTQGYIITKGGPLDSTLFYVIYLYRKTFEHFDAGVGSAMAWLLLVIVACITAFVFATSKYWVYYESERSK